MKAAQKLKESFMKPKPSEIIRDLEKENAGLKYQYNQKLKDNETKIQELKDAINDLQNSTNKFLGDGTSEIQKLTSHFDNHPGFL